MVSALQLLAGHIQFCSSFETRICQIFQQYFLIWVFCICWPTICGNQYELKTGSPPRPRRMDAWTMTRISHNREFRIFGGILVTISTEFHNFSTITYFRLDLSDVFPFSGATVCKAMTFPLHRMGFCHSGMMHWQTLAIACREGAHEVPILSHIKGSCENIYL